MNCQRIRLPDGSTALVCGLRRQSRRCTYCRTWAEYACDACDAPLCGRCRIHVPLNQDYCRAHRAQATAAAAQLRLFEDTASQETR